MNLPQQNGLRKFEQAARQLWKQYLSGGPGSLDAALWDELQSRYQLVSDLLPLTPELAEPMDKVMELARRCAECPEGLSFVTGEAGLIPRQAEHREFEHSLQQIAQGLGE